MASTAAAPAPYITSSLPYTHSLPQQHTTPPSYPYQHQHPHVDSSLFAQDDQQVELTLIDLQLLCQEDEAEIHKLLIAAKEWGFLQVANHGVSCKLLCEIAEQAYHAFTLPAEAKARAEPAAGSGYGYFTKQSGANGKRQQLSEAFRLPLNPEHRADVIIKLWPEGNKAFSSVVEEYIAAVESILLQLLRSFASGLGLDPLQFTHDLSKDGIFAVLRMNFYNASSQPLPSLAFQAHSDPPILTILHQNGVDGLQILKDNKWIAVKPQLGSFVVNVGDMLQVMSNDLYPSVIHRVVMKSDKFRSSLVLAATPHPQAIVRPAPQLVTEQRPSQYVPFTMEEYFSSLDSVEYSASKSHLNKFRSIPT
ncbi:hypothetical protein O6H91_19G044500 [Diphasiastrum complanatum]|uniref:Uncharacterized protein n=1 Tax=Diphasiastrum complanatum TaxID=34168 RepID=A0ACC2AVK8_DIPCM|nr:hypothetical protein O6H91_19G044500 [Diphasiastrum complanatum]